MEVTYKEITRKSKFDVGQDIWILNDSPKNGLSISCERIDDIEVLVGNHYIDKEGINIVYKTEKHEINDKRVGKNIFDSREKAKAEMNRLIDKQGGVYTLSKDLAEELSKLADSIEQNAKIKRRRNK